MIASAGVGLVGGFVSGFLGVGGGIVMVPLILLWVHTDRHTAHATSLTAIFAIAASALMGYAEAGAVDIPLGLALGAGGLIGAAFGARAMNRMSPTTLKGVFALALLVAGIRMLLP
jgi:uncharacterized membrane protein YfcA